MTDPWQLYHWHFEVSGKCTLRCPRCPRTEAAPVPWMNKELDLAFFKKVLPPDRLRDQVKRITMCGDIGDPIYASEYLQIVEYIKTHNPLIHVYTITNGSYRKPEWWQQLAEISNERDVINFSVDGYDAASNSQYRVGSDWNSIMQGMDIMCTQSSAFVYWAAIVFSFNQHHLHTIRQLAQDKGCDGLQLTCSTKFGSKYGEAYGGATDPLEPDAEFVSPTHRYQRSFEPLSDRLIDNAEYLQTNQQYFESVKSQHNSFVTPMCAIGNRGIYISADGVLHPCSWVSYPYTSLHTARKTIWFQDSFHQQHRDRLNLHLHSFDDVINDTVWHKLHHTFDNPDKAWVECEQKCHTNLVDQEYAVGWMTN